MSVKAEVVSVSEASMADVEEGSEVVMSKADELYRIESMPGPHRVDLSYIYGLQEQESDEGRRT